MIDIVFDGPPEAVSGRFVEVEDAETRVSVNVGEWIHRDDGYWVLRINYDAYTGETSALHNAEPFPQWAQYELGTACRHCGEQIRRVPGGNGPKWVHHETGFVVGKTP